VSKILSRLREMQRDHVDYLKNGGRSMVVPLLSLFAVIVLVVLFIVFHR
jgi:hypothetical protein